MALRPNDPIKANGRPDGMTATDETYQGLVDMYIRSGLYNKRKGYRPDQPVDPKLQQKDELVGTGND